MIHILTLVILVGSNVAIATAEYNSAAACEAAKAVDERALATANRQPMVIATCTAKD
jgi:hypothetical protein